MKRNLKVLFIGMGSIGKRNFSSCLRVRPNYEYAAIRSGKGNNETIQGMKMLVDWDSVDEFNPDGVWICNPTAYHVETLEKAVRFTRNVFCEKPLSHDISQLERVLKTHSDANLNFSYGCILRHHPLILRAKQIVETRVLGKPVKYSLRCGSDLRTWRSPDYRKSYSATRSLGGGVSLDLIHEFDYAEFIFGKLNVVGGFKTRQGALEIDSDDYCIALTVHEAGVRGSIELDYLRTSAKREFEIQFTDGLVVGNLITGELVMQSGFGKDTKEMRENLPILREKLDDIQSESVFSAFEGAPNSLWKVEEIVELNRKVVEIPFVQYGMCL